MPDKDGKFRGISVPRIPWRDSEKKLAREEQEWEEFNDQVLEGDRRGRRDPKRRRRPRHRRSDA